MTVSYAHKAATVKWWTFVRLLFRWKGSIYKMVLPDLIVFGFLFTLFSLVYRFAMNKQSKEAFEYFCVYCSRFENLIPVAFILGFFVQLIASRWWEQFQALPYPDGLALLLNSYIDADDDVSANKPAAESSPEQSVHVDPGPSRVKCHVDGGGVSAYAADGESELVSRSQRAQIVRRTIMRYINLSFVATFRRISHPLRKRIPSEEDFVRLQLMTEDEMMVWNSFPPDNKYVLPLAWCTDLISKALHDGLIKTHLYAQILHEEIDALRGKMGKIFTYDYINPPLAYTQAATICVYSYFLATLFGRQFLDPTKGYEHRKVDYYVPIFTIFQFVFYVGWLKVAEELINPFGNDDDDFDMATILKRNLQMSALIVDANVRQLPPLVEDLKWDVTDLSLPDSVGPQKMPHRRSPFTGSAHDLNTQPSLLDKLLRRPTRQTSTVSTGTGRNVARESDDNASIDIEMESLDLQKSETGTTVRRQASGDRQSESVDFVDQSSPLVSAGDREPSEVLLSEET